MKILRIGSVLVQSGRRLVVSRCQIWFAVLENGVKDRTEPNFGSPTIA
jgi:hypothetical protein